ncbi:hypothetical protein N7493_008528 [Penicillium malachiteum]|uniref:Uncharacterized protein n=1 Tax=Penicillium malachiteum TaxID=1324776 RepID=A0AAD6HHA7_9EURO|nr:hypothetical protein N7493_008528 [Penicillium malachiteum]
MLSLPSSSTHASKRKAENDMTSPPPVRRLRLSAPEPADPLPAGRKIAQPDSIQAILKENHRIRLYVHPIAWTEKQLQLLGFHFDQNLGKKKEKPVPPESQQSNCHDDGIHDTDSPAKLHRKALRLSQDLSGAAIRLIWNYDLLVKQYAMEEILNAYNIHPFEQEYPFSYDRLYFYFHGRPVAKLRTDRIFSSNSMAPSLAFITPRTIALRRQSHVSARPDRKKLKPNNPVDRIEWRKLVAIMPPNNLEDPYIASILIALAQEKRRQQQKQEQQGSEKQEDPATAKSEILEQLDADPTLSVEESSTSCPLSSSTEQMNQNTVDSSAFKVQVLVLDGESSASGSELYFYNASIPSEFLDKLDKPLDFSPSLPIEIQYCCIPLKASIRLVVLLARKSRSFEPRAMEWKQVYEGDLRGDQ